MLKSRQRLQQRQKRKESSTASVLLRLLQHLSLQRRWQLLGIAGLMLVSALAEAMTLGAVLPFLGVIVNPEQVFEYPLAAQLAEMLGFTDSEQLILPLTVTFAVVALMAGALRILVLWCNKSYSQWVGHELSLEVYRRTLYQPYQVHVASNTSELISSINKVDLVTTSLKQVLMLISSVVAVFAIALALIAMDPLVAVSAFVGFGGIYGLLIALTRRRLIRNSHIISRHLTLQVKSLQEGLGGIRDILLDHNQAFYCEEYRQVHRPFCKARAEIALMSGSPRYGMEALGMVLIAGFAYGLSQQPGGGSAALPVLGTLALGAQRLLPALQQIFAGWASIRGDQTSAEDVLKLLDQPLPLALLQLPVSMPLEWHSAIKVNHVGFKYSVTGPWVLKDVSFVVPKGYRVGFVGTTGSGKSTMVDLIMGLLEPTIGQILIDGLSLDSHYCQAWQRTIAHVPQHIYLADTTIAENIALGVPKNSIDLARVRHAAQQAKIADFIEQEPDSYWAELGERGIRLSGGQRQRIGIARALYKQASVLMFDEATSALDNATEQEVMSAINDLADDLTILMIAHRLSTVEQCDLIIELDQGRVVAQGTYQELMNHSTSFQRMAGSRAR